MNLPSVLHSVSYSGSWGQAFLSVEDFIDKAAELGFDGVMLMAKRPHLSVLDWDADSVKRLRERLDRRELRLGCLAGYTNFTADLEHGEIPHREMQISHVTELARLAHGLGGNLVRVFTGYDHPASNLAAQSALVVQSLRECARRAAGYGVTVGVQNHHDIACDYDSMADLIEEIGEANCRAMFDAWAPALQGVDPAMTAARMAPLTVFTTIADYQLRPRFQYRPALVNYEKQTPAVQAVPMGEGLIDYLAFLRTMQQHGFAGSVAYEMCSPLKGGGSIENLDRYAARFQDFMRSYRTSLPSD